MAVSDVVDVLVVAGFVEQLGAPDARRPRQVRRALKNFDEQRQ
ncbi:hypothetical protein [Gordonia paraffinivorans]